MLKRFLLTALAVFGIVVIAWADSPDGIPDIHEGDVWMYRSIDAYTNETTLEFSHRVVKVDNKEITVQVKNKNVSGSKLVYVTREWNMVDTGDTRFEPFYPEYRFPLSVGALWTMDYKSTNNHGSSSSGFVTVKVVALEKVTVPAGTFDAYRIERDIEARGAAADANTTKGKIITWYAPLVKKYVRREVIEFSNGRERGKKVDELLEYSLRKKSVAPSS